MESIIERRKRNIPEIRVVVRWEHIDLVISRDGRGSVQVDQAHRKMLLVVVKRLGDETIL